jgi:hypothetical protein
MGLDLAQTIAAPLFVHLPWWLRDHPSPLLANQQVAALQHGKIIR